MDDVGVLLSYLNIRLTWLSQGLASLANEKYETALQAASYSGHLQIAQFLAAKGANVNARGEDLIGSSIYVLNIPRRTTPKEAPLWSRGGPLRYLSLYELKVPKRCPSIGGLNYVTIRRQPPNRRQRTRRIVGTVRPVWICYGGLPCDTDRTLVADIALRNLSIKIEKGSKIPRNTTAHLKNGVGRSNHPTAKTSPGENSRWPLSWPVFASPGPVAL